MIIKYDAKTECLFEKYSNLSAWGDTFSLHRHNKLLFLLSDSTNQIWNVQEIIRYCEFNNILKLLLTIIKIS